ncbi:MAG: lactonase family protein [Paludibacter sp.]|nr:lactonase family protein [Paludibacter sp.]
MKRKLFLLLLTGFIYHISAQTNNYRLLIGTYTNSGKSEGVYSYEVNVEAGVFTQKAVARELVNPSYLALSSDKKFVYAVSESGTASKAGAFAFDAKNGDFRFLNSSDTHGQGPCYITASDKHVFTANYGGGSISVFGRKPDGSLSELLQLIKHTGSSINPKRQIKPYVHQVIFTPDMHYLLANDLGTDLVTVYRYDKNGKDEILTPHDSIRVKAGSGPRHLTISKNGKYVYLLQELDGTVSVMTLNKGRLKVIQETSVVLKQGVETGAADIHLSPDGKFLYATNRGTINDITCFAVGKDGKLTLKQQIPTGGIAPRNFSLTPDGKYLFIGNQRSDQIVIMKRDKKSGALSVTGKSIQVGAPVCLIFY